jgi:hypothetical protein
MRIDRTTDTQGLNLRGLGREGVMAGLGPGAVLEEAAARREYALAYRATVDDVYAMAALEPGAPTR